VVASAHVIPVSYNKVSAHQKIRTSSAQLRSRELPPKFERLALWQWRQFDDVEINFDSHLTILTGANGAGKTTILNLLAKHFGWSIALTSTLGITRRGAWKYFTGAESHSKDDESPEERLIGELSYTDGYRADLRVPPTVNETFNLKVVGQPSLSGIYITSHRPVYSYQKVENIPTTIQANQELFDQYVNNLRQYYSPKARIESPSYRLKSALISLATFGYGNKAVHPNDDARRTFESFQDILKLVLPSDLRFRAIRIRLPDVIIECEGTSFSVDAASGGIAALIDLSWQIHMKSLTSDSFIVVLDEPENHLHPRLQRTVLPGLVEAFPNAQFVAATHNPFVVTSVPGASVVVLDFVDERVRSSNLSDLDRAASANDVLMDVLGVPSPMPLWVEKELDGIVMSIEGKEIDANLLRETRSRLNRLGMGDMFPNVIERLLRQDGGEE
jgi:predicted ATPase